MPGIEPGSVSIKPPIVIHYGNDRFPGGMWGMGESFSAEIIHIVLEEQEASHEIVSTAGEPSPDEWDEKVCWDRLWD